jgi:hypothetical protein
MSMKTPFSKFRTFIAIAALLPVIGLLATGCGDTFNVNDLGNTPLQPTYGDTTYVLQSPVWTGFNNPTDIIVGNEPFIYIADAGNNRIVMLDISGALTGHSGFIKNPVAIAQDHRLNLIVCAELDTTINGQAATYGAIYKIDMYAAQHNIAAAAIKLVYFEPTNTMRRYTGVAVLADNKYYVARTGPNNSSIIDPDDAVMMFDSHDAVRSREYWPALSVDGTGLATITQPTSIATFSKVTTDFVFTQTGTKSYFKTQWMTLRSSGDVTQWESYFTPSSDGSVDFLKVNLFKQPEDVTVDGSGNIYVVDAGLNQMVRFNSSGLISQIIKEGLNHPSGVAYFDKTLYIADAGSNRILRYILSTDIR